MPIFNARSDPDSTARYTVATDTSNSSATALTRYNRLPSACIEALQGSMFRPGRCANTDRGSLLPAPAPATWETGKTMDLVTRSVKSPSGEVLSALWHDGPALTPME